MSENIIGARESDVMHRKKTAEGSLTVTHNTQDIVANTIGHVLAVPFRHLPLWTLDAAFQNPPKELSTQLFERYKDVPWKGDVMVRVGHTSILGDLQRLWASYDKVKGKSVFSTTHWMIDRLARVLYTPIQVLRSAMAKIDRLDYYDSITNTAVVYHPNLAFGMHELGHAKFWDESKHKEAWTIFYPTTFVRSYAEWKASAHAMKQFKTDTERRKALKVLEPAWSSYFITDMISLVGGSVAIPPLAAIVAPFASGHVMARLYPKQNERFGYIFSGKEIKKEVPKKQELSAHQVLVATAKAPKHGNELPVEGKGGRQFSDEPLKNGKRPQHSNTHRITF